MGTIAVMKMGLLWISWLVMITVFSFMELKGGEMWVMVAITGSLVLADSAIEACQAVCHGFERMDVSSVVGVGYRLLTVGGGITAIAAGTALHQVVGAMSVGGWIAVAASMWFINRQLIPFRWVWRVEMMKSLLSEGWPLAVSGLFTALYFRLDTVILAQYASAHEVGWYGAAYKIYEMSMFVPALVASVVLPTVARTPTSEVRAVCLRILGWFGSAAVAAGVMGVAASPFLVQYGLGATYEPSLAFLPLLMIAMSGMWIHHVGGAVLIALMGQRSLAWWTACVAVASVAAYRWWIPEGGAMAAAWITVTTDAVLAIGTMLLLWRRLSHA